MYNYLRKGEIKMKEQNKRGIERAKRMLARLEEKLTLANEDNLEDLNKITSQIEKWEKSLEYWSMI